MAKKIIVHGVLAGLLAFVFARIFAEPQIQRVIDYESGRDAVRSALDKAAGLPYGVQSTQTSLPLRNAQGTIVYPGFPADTLFLFRFRSVAQLILWVTIGLAFGPPAERLFAPAREMAVAG